MRKNIYYLQALSPVHIGVGQAIGAVDLPIMRSKSTNLPLIPSSALKGVLRDLFNGNDYQRELFGPFTANNAEAMAGALLLGDAQVLLLPVRSFAGIFAYITCPYVLSQFSAALLRCGAANVPSIPSVPENKAIIAAEQNSIITKNDMVYLEDLDLSVTKEENAQKWVDFLTDNLFAKSESIEFKERFLIVSDDTFSFLSETATEIRARIRINDERGIVEEGALWYEENLPSETIFWGLLIMENGKISKSENVSNAKSKKADDLYQSFQQTIAQNNLLQVGGKATIGRGLVNFKLGV